MVKIQHTTFEELFHAEGFSELVNEYSQETANKAIGDPMVQYERYRKLEYTGNLFCIAAYDKGKVVGVVGLLLAESQHYPFPIVAVESFYLRKAWRKGVAGLRLLKEIKKTAWKLGAPGCSFMAPPGSSLDKLCEHLGMVHTHNAFWCKCDDIN